MPNLHVTDRQVMLYMTRSQQHDQESAAAMAGFSARTARRIDKDPRLPSQKRQPRTWRTRTDPLTDVWPRVLEMLKIPGMMAVTIFEDLQDEVGPEVFPDRVRRTLERRIARWRALHGEDKEVYFPQRHDPGRRSRSHTRSNICQPENVESRTCVSSLLCAAKPQSASPLFQYERQGAPRLRDYPQLCMQKSHRDRQVRRVHSGASCTPIATEHLFDLLISRQIAPSRACFDDRPFLFADVVVRAPLFHLADETRDLSVPTHSDQPFRLIPISGSD
jgi:hypothetical protein